MGRDVTHLGPSLRRTRKRSRPWVRAAVAVFLSLLANALVLREVRVDFLTPRKVETPRAVALAPLSASEWEANRRATAAPQQQRPQQSPPVAALPPRPPP